MITATPDGRRIRLSSAIAFRSSGTCSRTWRHKHQVERMIGKTDVADVDAKVDVGLEQIASLIALDPFLADVGGQARLGREVENVLALENGLLVGADGERPMTLE